MTDWMSAAFLHSKENKIFHQTMKYFQSKNDKSSAITTLTRRTSDMTYDIFELDWLHMHWEFLDSKWHHHIDTSIKFILKAHYPLLCKIYSHYCGYKKAEEEFGMTFKEFIHLFHMSEILDLNYQIDEICKFMES